MKASGVSELPLHSGKCPPWLFRRMKELGKAISELMIHEHGEDEFIRRISDPFFFQSLSCVLGYDWHSSGTTTTTCGALKEALNSMDVGIRIVGGKGRVSRMVPDEIRKVGEEFGFSDSKVEELIRISKLVAKIDSAAVQDGYDLYHHSMFLSESGKWAVIQQGMCIPKKYARRYHWIWEVESFVNDPHAGIVSDAFHENVLNLVSRDSDECRKIIRDLVRESSARIKCLHAQAVRDAKQMSLSRWIGVFDEKDFIQSLSMPAFINWKALENAYELQPRNFEEVLLVPGMGAGTVRALALISELVYGVKASWKDPAKYSFAFGGKDGVPYPVNRRRMDEAIQFLRDAISMAKMGDEERLRAFKRLSSFGEL